MRKDGERSWSILTPTIRKAESEIWVTRNPELDTDPTWIRLVETPFPDTLDIEMNWRDNPWFNDVLEKERLHAQATMSTIDYENIWHGKSRPAISGTIYADEVASMHQQGRIGKYPYDPRLLIYPLFDRGFTDKMAIGCWQRRCNEPSLYAERWLRGLGVCGNSDAAEVAPTSLLREVRYAGFHGLRRARWAVRCILAVSQESLRNSAEWVTEIHGFRLCRCRGPKVLPVRVGFRRQACISICDVG